MVMVHGCMSPGVEIKMKSVYFTRPSTRACDLAMLHKLVYPTGLPRPSTRPGTRACVATSKDTRARHTGVWLAL
ncbi:hypothetical protein F383_35339 [Gossypium arboreum]|uniref:Uncharacterized protein n=1 Tax=Gossypium arboreum TaxID=29729 RepID=A0A0B0PPE6_GOSAR|nr:hypothetical protein F383_35339 [Gossypium arboreum]